MRCLPPLTALLLVAGCGTDPDARKAPEEDQLTAKAVADVDAAMAEARGTPPPTATPAPTPAPAAPAK